MSGRRLPDTRYADLPLPLDELQPGDIWKYLVDGKPMLASEYCAKHHPASRINGNLEDTCWGFWSPDGNGLGFLIWHTVREHEDGTVSIRPGDGSSNSILHRGGAQRQEWHGYVEHNVWQPC